MTITRRKVRGHVHNTPGDADNRFNSDVDWVQFCRKHPFIIEGLVKPARISYDYHIPYLGGISSDGQIVFLDARYRPLLRLRDIQFDSAPTIAEHEIIEFLCIQHLGMAYDTEDPLLNPHVWANTGERLAVRSRGASWTEYNSGIDSQLAGVELEEVVHCPPNLFLAPYQDDPELLRKIQAAMQE